MIDIRGLAYVVVETTDLDRWRVFAESVLGMATSPSADGGLYVRMDERQFRFAVQPGQRDAYVVSGWEVADQAAFEAGVSVLKASKVDVKLADAAHCQLRCAQAVSYTHLDVYKRQA